MKRHCKEKSEKCNQCGFACHNQLKNINGESQYHCNQCDFACSSAQGPIFLMYMFKTLSGEKSNNLYQRDNTSTTFSHLKKTHYTLANSATNAICATMQPLKLVI